MMKKPAEMCHRCATLIVVAAVAMLASCTSDSPTKTTTAGPPAELDIVSGDAQSGTVGQELSEALVVKVRDANGNPVSAQVVNFHVTAGGGSVFAGSSSTNADGIAQERWTLGTVAGAEQSVEVRAVDNATGQAIVFATFHATAVAGSATALSIVTQPATTARAGAPLSPQPVVRLVDKYGNAVPQNGVNVTASALPATGHTLTGPSTIRTDNQGVATFTDLAISGSTGAVAIDFSSQSLTDATSASITLSSGAAVSMVATTPTSLSGSVGSTLAASLVEVTDQSGNPVAGVTVNFTGSQGSNVSNVSLLTDSKGLAGFRWTLPTVAGTYSVTASSTGLTGSPIVFTATASTAQATHIEIVSGNNFTDTVGKAAPPLVVRVHDDFGNLVSGATVTWHATTNSGGGAPTLSGSTSVTGADGTAQISATLQTQTGATTSGAGNVTASLANSASVMFTLTAIAGPATAIAKQAGDNQSAQVSTKLPIPLVVHVTDRYGNPADATVNFAVTAGGGSVDPTSGRTSNNGIVGVLWTLGPDGGTQTVTASVGGLSTVFTATGLQYHLSMTQQPPASATSTFLLGSSTAVRLVDAGGNTVSRSGIIVTASAPSPNSLSGLLTSTTDVTGAAVFSHLAISGPAGSVSLTFSGLGLTPVTSNAIALAAQPAMTLRWNGSDGSTVTVGTYLSSPMTLRVTDASGNPLPNVMVTFSVIAGAGTITTYDEFLVNQNQLTSGPQLTDSNGQAQLRTWTIGPNPGPNTVRATVGNVSTDFTLNAVSR